MSSMSLSNTNNHADTNNFASYLNSVPATLSERTKQHNADAPNDGGNDDNGPTIHMTMGNEAGDADSIISALALGYVVQSQILSSDQNVDADNSIQEIVVPIVSVPRTDLSLRRDVMLLLDLADITVENLLYVDDDIVSRNLLPSSYDKKSSQSDRSLPRTLTLVDHNRIRSSLSHLSTLVSEIVDHHVDEKSHQDVVTTDSGKRIIAFENGQATVASTCTLVTERIFQHTALGDQSATISINGSLGLLLLGVILLDSVNMLAEAGKGTARDEKAMQMLLHHTGWASYHETVRMPSLVDATTLERIFPNGRSSMPDRTALFEVLSGAKNDPQFWSELSVMDCLRIDYKKFLVSGQSHLVSSIGLSSVLLDMDSLLSKENFLDDLTAFAALSDVGLFGIMAVNFRDGKPNRELLLTGSNTEIVDSFTNYLLNHPDAAFLEITERKDCMDDGAYNAAPIRVFQQGNGKGSRKQVAPILLGHAATMSRL